MVDVSPAPAPVFWLTGLSGAGKSTLAQALAKTLRAEQRPVLIIDGDVLRGGLCKDLGFGHADRQENIRRAAEVAKLAAHAGVTVIVALISPFRADRQAARLGVQPAAFFEVHVDAPLAVVEARDPKGLYAKARRGELSQFTGIDSPYEAPEHPELRIDTSRCSPEQAVDRLIQLLRH